MKIDRQIPSRTICNKVGRICNVENIANTIKNCRSWIIDEVGFKRKNLRFFSESLATVRSLVILLREDLLHTFLSLSIARNLFDQTFDVWRLSRKDVPHVDRVENYSSNLEVKKVRYTVDFHAYILVLVQWISDVKVYFFLTMTRCVERDTYLSFFFFRFSV